MGRRALSRELFSERGRDCVIEAQVRKCAHCSISRVLKLKNVSVFELQLIWRID